MNADEQKNYEKLKKDIGNHILKHHRNETIVSILEVMVPQLLHGYKNVKILILQNYILLSCHIAKHSCVSEVDKY